MHKLNGMTMRPNQDPGFQQRDELEHIGGSFTEARILEIILKGASNEYEPIRFAAERDPKISLNEIEITIRNMYRQTRLARCGSTYSREKGRQSAMKASSGLKRSCDYCSKPSHKHAQYFKVLRESGGRPLTSSGAGRSSWCSLHSTHLHDNADCHAQQQHRGNGNGSGYSRGNNNSGIGNIRHHGDGSNTGRANTSVTTNGTSTPAVIAPAPASPVVTAPSIPVAAPPAPFTAPPTRIMPKGAPTPYVNESPPSGVGFSFLAGSATPGPLNFTLTSDCGASSHFVDSNLIGDIKSRMKSIVKLDSPATIVVAGHSTLRGVSMGTLTVRVTDAQGFRHDMLLAAMNVPGLGRHLFLGGTAALKEINTIIAKESDLDVGQFKIPLHKTLNAQQ